MDNFPMTQAELYQEHLDHEFGAQFDDVRERYAAEAADMANEGRWEAEHEAEMAEAEDLRDEALGAWTVGTAEDFMTAWTALTDDLPF